MTGHDPTGPPTSDDAGTHEPRESTAPAQPAPPSLRGPVRPGERALAPDLARGFMLLLIVLANSTWYLWAASPGELSIHPSDGSLLDRIVQGVLITAVDARTYPIFAFLFGYGMVQLWLRQRAAGATERDVRALLRRRNLWLLVFGFVHAALLWLGDVLGAYGFAGLIFGWLFLRRTDRTLLVWSGIFTGLLAALTALSVLAFIVAPEGAAPAEPAESGSPSWFPSSELNAEENYLASMVLRIQVWAFLVVGQGLLTISVPIAILLGFWAARRRILEEPGNHLRLLRITAAVGIPLGWLTGLLHALDHVGILSLSAEESVAVASIASTTGIATGLGYVALFGLIAHRLSRRTSRGPVLTALTAVGKRSLSCYLAQSVLCAPVLTAWGLGLGAHLHSATMALFATGVWLVTALLSYLQERAGQRGPAEVLLRRLSYRASHS